MDTLDRGSVSSNGNYVVEFEERLAKYTGVSRVNAVVNGTSALHTALRVLGVNADMEVITQALTFVAVPNAISYTGAQPIFIDVDLDTMGMSPEALRSFLEVNVDRREEGAFNRSTGKKIGACIPMHTFGFPLRITEIVEICAEYGIPVIEDAAQAMGSRIGDQHVGSYGMAGTLSFNGNKPLTAGGGGAILWMDEKLADKGVHISNVAKRAHPYAYYHDEIGFNYRMPNINAALALGQLNRLDERLAIKRQWAEFCASRFDELGVKMRLERTGTSANYWLIALELNDSKERDFFLEATNKAGVMTRPIWNLMSDLPMYHHCQRDELTNSKWLEERVVNIPSNPAGGW